MELKDLMDGNCYHICTNGQETPLLMRDEDDYRIACVYLALVSWKLNIDVLAYIVMSNHVHVVVNCRERKDAEKYIRLYKQRLSLYLKHKYGDGKIFHGVTDSITLVDSLRYFQNCIAYVLRNAICANVCKRIEDYPWSSYHAYFRSKSAFVKSITSLNAREKRLFLRTNDSLSGCPFLIDDNGRVEDRSFVRYDVVEAAFKSSSRAFIYFLGTCNDSKMEYEMALKPLVHVNDMEMMAQAEQLVSSRYVGKTLSDLTTSNKCAMVKALYFNNKTSVPQLSRILGLSREVVAKILTY